MKIEEYPSIAVLCATWNSEQYVEQALQSVLQQRYPGEIHLYIYENNSDDDTRRIVRRLSKENSFFHTTYGDENIGAYNALNQLIEKADQELIAIQDHDDIWHPNKLITQTHIMKKENADICTTQQIRWYEEQNQGYVVPGWFKHTTLLYDADINFYYSPDKYDHSKDGKSWKNHIEKHGLKSTQCKNILCLRRIHGENHETTWNRAKLLESIKQREGIFNAVWHAVPPSIQVFTAYVTRSQHTANQTGFKAHHGELHNII